MSAVRTLLGLVDGRPPESQHQVVPVELVIGRTSAEPC